MLLSRSSLEPLISLDLDSTKLYCFRTRVHCYYCLSIVFSTNPVRRSKELRGGPINEVVGKRGTVNVCEQIPVDLSGDRAAILNVIV